MVKVGVIFSELKVFQSCNATTMRCRAKQSKMFSKVFQSWNATTTRNGAKQYKMFSKCFISTSQPLTLPMKVFLQICNNNSHHLDRIAASKFVDIFDKRTNRQEKQCERSKLVYHHRHHHHKDADS